MHTRDNRVGNLALGALTILLILSLACISAPGGGGGGGDTSPDSGAPDSPTTAPQGPIEASVDEWTWVDFPNTRCGNGQTTGLGVNLTDRSDDVVVYFQGGGACWDVNTCFVLNSAVNINTGYPARRFENEPTRNTSAFDRDDPENPFRDASFVFVPYCTGDLYSGDHVESYQALGQTRDVHHVGAANVEAYLERLAPTFPGERKILVTGSSAGGYGAQLSFHQFHDAFPDAELHSLSDSGPMVQPLQGRWTAMARAWEPRTPEGCEDCIDGLPQWLDHTIASYPDSRFGLLSYDTDTVISVYFGYPLDGAFTNALSRLADDSYAPASNAHHFILAGTEHTMLGNLTNISSPDGLSLSAWLSSWSAGDEGWIDVAP